MDSCRNALPRTAAPVFKPLIEDGERAQAQVLLRLDPPPFKSKGDMFEWIGAFLIDQLNDPTSTFHVDLKQGDREADFCMGVGGAHSRYFAEFRMLEHPGPSSADGLAYSSRVINACLETAGGWIDDDTEEELIQYLYGILKTHGLSPGLGACTSVDSEFVLNINRGGANAGLGSLALYLQLHDRLARPRGDRSVEHNLRATGKDAYTLKTDAYTLKTDAFSLETDAYSLETDAHTLKTDALSLGTGLVALGLDKKTLKICKGALGTSKYARNSSTDPRLQSPTSVRSSAVQSCAGVFQPSNNVMDKFDHPRRYLSPRGSEPQIRCKMCKKFQMHNKYAEAST